MEGTHQKMSGIYSGAKPSTTSLLLAGPHLLSVAMIHQNTPTSTNKQRLPTIQDSNILHRVRTPRVTRSSSQVGVLTAMDIQYRTSSRTQGRYTLKMNAGRIVQRTKTYVAVPSAMIRNPKPALST